MVFPVPEAFCPARKTEADLGPHIFVERLSLFEFHARVHGYLSTSIRLLTAIPGYTNVLLHKGTCMYGTPGSWYPVHHRHRNITFERFTKPAGNEVGQPSHLARGDCRACALHGTTRWGPALGGRLHFLTYIQ